MGSVNKAIIVGNLGKDAEVRYTSGGDPVATISVATTETWNDKTTGPRQEKTEWHRVVIWGKRPRPDETAQTPQWWQYLLKGRQVYVEGRIQTRQWDDKAGNKRYTTEIRSDRVVLVGGRGDGPDRVGASAEPSSGGGPAPGPPELTEDDIPF